MPLSVRCQYAREQFSSGNSLSAQNCCNNTVLFNFRTLYEPEQRGVKSMLVGSLRPRRIITQSLSYVRNWSVRDECQLFNHSSDRKRSAYLEHASGTNCLKSFSAYRDRECFTSRIEIVSTSMSTRFSMNRETRSITCISRLIASFPAWQLWKMGPPSKPRWWL